MNAKLEKAIDTKSDQIGNPQLVVLAKNRGAWPAKARPYSAREEVYMSDEAAETADVRRQALMTLGRPFIPAALMAMTKGDRAAV